MTSGNKWLTEWQTKDKQLSDYIDGHSLFFHSIAPSTTGMLWLVPFCYRRDEIKLRKKFSFNPQGHLMRLKLQCLYQIVIALYAAKTLTHVL